MDFFTKSILIQFGLISSLCAFLVVFYCENIEIGGNCLCYFDEFILLIYSNKRKNFIDKLLNMNVRRRHYFWMEMVYPKTHESATLFQLFNSINFFSSIINTWNSSKFHDLYTAKANFNFNFSR